MPSALVPAAPYGIEDALAAEDAAQGEQDEGKMSLARCAVLPFVGRYYCVERRSFAFGMLTCCRRTTTSLKWMQQWVAQSLEAMRAKPGGGLLAAAVDYSDLGPDEDPEERALDTVAGIIARSASGPLGSGSHGGWQWAAAIGMFVS